ncbi:MAG: hypothetical protein JNM56_18520, partial [Planctomycetia bacterium]|nr:hypothetical protein [Planctomycetia bacterium]
NLALDKHIEKKDWEKANQQLRGFLKAIKAAQIAAEKSDGLEDDGEGIRNLFDTDDAETKKAKEDAKNRDEWTKVIKDLAQRARKLDDPQGIPVRNRIAGLFPLLKEGDWEDVEDRVEGAKAMLAEAEKAQKDAEALNAKKLAEVTKALKDLAQRARKLKDAKGNDLSKKVAALTPLLPDKDWPAIEKQLAEVEQEVKDAENRLEEDDKQRARFTAEFKKLAARAAKLDDTAIRNRVAGLFSLIQEKDWEGIRKSLDEAVKLVEAAEQRGTTAPPE